MGLFAGLKKIREFERMQLPFIKSIYDFDIVVEIGLGEELGSPLSLKQLSLCKIGSLSTISRRLSILVEQGIVMREKHLDDNRTTRLLIAPSALKLLGKYGSAITGIASQHFGKTRTSRQVKT